MRKTKIVCTLGPACANEEVLEEMLKNGMNIARFNFSHGTHEYHKESMARFRRVRDRLHLPAALMLDTKGPEIRLGDFENGRVTLQKGSLFTLATDGRIGDESSASITFADLPNQLKVGTRILLDDGRVAMHVEEIADGEIRCRVDIGGELSNHKSINIPNVHIDMPYISRRDEEDLIFGIEQDIDFVAASFTRSVFPAP